MRLFFRAPAFFVLRAQKVGLRRRETEACGGRTFAYAHRRAAVCAGGAGKRCAPERDFFRSRSRPQALSPHGNLLQKREVCCKNTVVFFGYPVPAAYARPALHGRAGVGQYAAR